MQEQHFLFAMVCFGGYDHSNMACESCKVKNSCKRERNKKYEAVKIKNNLKSNNSTKYLGKVRNKLLDTMLSWNKPMCTSKIVEYTRGWKNTTASGEVIKQSLHDLHKMGYLRLIKKKRAKYWIVAI